MATIPIPSTLKITGLSFGIESPGQAVFRSIYSGSTQRIIRGAGYFVGSVRFGAADASVTGSQARVDAEGFLARLKGIENEFEIPIPQPEAAKPTGSATVRVSSETAAGGDLRLLTFASTSGSYNIPAGSYISAGGRLYIVTASTDSGTGDTLDVQPNIPTGTTSNNQTVVEYNNPVVKAHRADGSAVASSISGDFTESWGFNWTEVRGG